MGYCISEGDFPTTGLAAGEVDAEARRESFVLVDDDDGRIELLYTDIPRLKQLIAFIEERYYDTESEEGLLVRIKGS